MSQFEYRIETLPGNGHAAIASVPGESPASDVLERLTELGQDGWHVNALQGAAYGLAPTQVLLERDLSEGEAFRRLFAPGA
ncbi:MAG: hypothetical protein M0Z49_05665 [Chloroflexi bacterium]|nr:hypothetical protein [Chloroflexota bacterium]